MLASSLNLISLFQERDQGALDVLFQWGSAGESRTGDGEDIRGPVAAVGETPAR